VAGFCRHKVEHLGSMRDSDQLIDSQERFSSMEFVNTPVSISTTQQPLSKSGRNDSSEDWFRYML
jgi:hypothetical protein